MADVAAALAFARAQIGEPYRLGSEGPGEWDCSGLVQAAWAAGGVKLPRTSTSMLTTKGAVEITRKSELQPGDLVWPHLGHVQLYSGNGKIIEAPRTGLTVREREMWGFWTARRVTGASVPKSSASAQAKLRAGLTIAASAVSPLGALVGGGASGVAGQVTDAAEGVADVATATAGALAALTRPTTWLRIGKAAIGGWLVVAGLTVAIGPMRAAQAVVSLAPAGKAATAAKAAKAGA